MEKIKVLHVHTLAVISGSGINTLLTMKGLNRNRYDVEFATEAHGALIDEAKEAGIICRPVKHLVQPVNFYSDIRALWELICLMRSQRYAIVHTHNSKAGFIGRLAAKFAGVPIIIHTIHGFSFHACESRLRRWFFCNLERLAAPWADTLITISRPLTTWGLTVGIGSPKQYVTIYSGIELEKFKIDTDNTQKKKELGIPPENKVIGVVSKLWEGKGHCCILEAAVEIIKTIPNISFLFVGEGYLQEKLEGLSKKLGLSEHVIFTGFRRDIPEIVATFDIALLVSLFEGMGRVLLEAMALGKPVIATRVGGIVDVVDDGSTGILVEPEDSSALAEAIVELLTNNELSGEMGEAGKDKINEKFSAQIMVKRIGEIYEELLVKKNVLSRMSKV